MKDIPFLKRIRTKVIFFSIVLSIVTITVTGLVIVSFSRSVLKRNIEQRNYQIARRASSEISLFYDDAVDLIRSASIVSSILPDPMMQLVALENMSDGQERYSRFRIYGENGEILATVEGAPEIKVDVRETGQPW